MMGSVCVLALCALGDQGSQAQSTDTPCNCGLKPELDSAEGATCGSICLIAVGFWHVAVGTGTSGSQVGSCIVPWEGFGTSPTLLCGLKTG